METAIKILALFVPAVVSCALGWAVGKLQQLKKEKAALAEKEDADAVLLRESIKAIMRHLIREYYKECLKNGCCTLADKEEITEIYALYRSLGGNGNGKRMYEALMALPEQTDCI